MRLIPILALALPAILSAQVITTPSIGGFTLQQGGCFTQAVTFSGAMTGSTVLTVSPEAFPGNGIWWGVYVSAPNQATVKVCSSLTQFVPAEFYDVELAGPGMGVVTTVTATAPITSSGGTTPNISALYQGGGNVIQKSTGATTPNDCVKFDASGNTVDAGAACGSVTGVTATAPITSTGGATPNISASYQGNGSMIQASTGATTPNDCVKYDASGNTVDAGGPCFTGTPVTTVTATAPITSTGGSTPNISATYQGTGTKIQASTGSTTTNDCVKFDANGNTTDAGAPCGTGDGTVTSVTATGPITSSGGATPNISATYQGNGLKIQASTGTTTTNDCVKFDANGNTIDAGAACGTVLTIASGTVALGTTLISSGACAAAVTGTASGTQTTDNIEADFNADPTSTTGYTPSSSGMLTIIKYPTANTVNFKVCNNTGNSITPGAVTLNWRVLR